MRNSFLCQWSAKTKHLCVNDFCFFVHIFCFLGWSFSRQNVDKAVEAGSPGQSGSSHAGDGTCYPPQGAVAASRIFQKISVSFQNHTFTCDRAAVEHKLGAMPLLHSGEARPSSGVCTGGRGGAAVQARTTRVARICSSPPPRWFEAASLAGSCRQPVKVESSGRRRGRQVTGCGRQLCCLHHLLRIAAMHRVKHKCSVPTWGKGAKKFATEGGFDPPPLSHDFGRARGPLSVTC